MFEVIVRERRPGVLGWLLARVVYRQTNLPTVDLNALGWALNGPNKPLVRLPDQPDEFQRGARFGTGTH